MGGDQDGLGIEIADDTDADPSGHGFVFVGELGLELCQANVPDAAMDGQ